jgi:hypothetical protein
MREVNLTHSARTDTLLNLVRSDGLPDRILRIAVDYKPRCFCGRRSLQETILPAVGG